ncbi:MAG TPA: cysteine desulfurase family protein [bacterium]|nr:cysteine desulfurase family protein [bacterium]HQI48894.1 cysteine desulfurase family protein [bacterium]HQJ64798.1 cysteine desulfurase family protein [bacterium]
MKPIYMDHHATTPLEPEVLEAMMPYLTTEFGNPSSSTHDFGRRARAAVENAREEVAAMISAERSDEIIFTSGATESDNLVLKGLALQRPERSGHIITLAIEHKAILDTAQFLQEQGFDVSLAPVDRYGVVDLAALEQLIRSDTFLISIQAANSEIGTTQPLAAIGAIARSRGILFHTDAVQALGKIDIQVVRDQIDLLSISGHKIYGPKGVGALYIRKGIRLQPLFHGGGHESGMRSGTLNVPGIVGLGRAALMARRDMTAESARLIELREMLRKGIESRIDRVVLNGHPTQRLPNNLNYSFSFVEGESLMLACRGIALSSGSACTSTSLQSSYVLRALNVPETLAHCSIRFGLGRSNTREHIEILLDLLETHVRRLREMSPLYDMAKEGIDIENFAWGAHDHHNH